MKKGTQTFKTIKIYDNKVQADIAIQIVIFLNQKVQVLSDSFAQEDAMKGAIVAAARFALQTYYRKTGEFTKDNKREVEEMFSKCLDSHVDPLIIEQPLPH